MREPADGLDILRKHLEPRVDDDFNISQHALEVGCERLDGGLRITRLDSPNASRVVGSAPVLQVVPVDGSEHDILQLHQLNSMCRIPGLIGIQPAARITRVDCAEPARARTNSAHEHDGGGAGVPALPDVRALRLLAHRREPVLFDDSLHALEAHARRRLGPEPGRLAGQRSPDGGASLRLDTVTNCGKPLRRNVFFATPRPRRFLDDRDIFQIRHTRHCTTKSPWRRIAPPTTQSSPPVPGARPLAAPSARTRRYSFPPRERTSALSAASRTGVPTSHHSPRCNSPRSSRAAIARFSKGNIGNFPAEHPTKNSGR